jgi:hypothetical protein
MKMASITRDDDAITAIARDLLLGRARFRAA